ncbi:FAD-dependent oxidoreductase [Agromyces seonyuensis]|uniref:NAD(P)-binding protein n=1 Tax=Agromyces seonyuensis TaxID=2662446 RepID=A0A6I4P0S7_9MICO|nr:FAD-dependent oxidoreductase [Agromyces seonyuensis]MWB99961.1 NAD(P)-binding protein [Agromyces seonyuensis]
MDGRSPERGMPRRTFLTLSFAGIGALALAACTQTPAPTPSPTPSPTPAPTPLPTVPGVPAPLAMTRSNWSADPWTLGGTVFEPVGGTAEARATLRTPVDARIWFAGEALPEDGVRIGTLAAARASGAAVADDVLRTAESGERVAVIGAGVAGLAAAARLADAGFAVSVFEARRTVGGRAANRTVSGFDDPVRYGAVLVPDDLDVLYDLARADVRTVTFAPELLVRRDDGVEVAPSAFGIAALQQAHEYAAAQPEDSSMSAALAASGATPVSPEPGPDGVSEGEWLEYALRSALAPATGASSSRVSATEYDPVVIGDALRGAKYPTAGIGAWIDGIAGRRDVQVAVGSAVSEVRLGTERVSLRFDTGESFSAHRVVVAVPHGVLREQRIGFVPELPDEYAAAIAAIPVGDLDVVWLRFEEAFWRPEATAADEGTGVATAEPNEDDAAEPAVIPQRLLTVVGGAPGVAAWLDPADSEEAVLVGVVAGAAGTRLGALGDDDFLAAALDGLTPYGMTTADSSESGDVPSESGDG